MMTNKKFVLISLNVILAICLGACGPSATPAPTVDVNAISTQVAATVVAGITQTAAAMPSATPIPSPTPQPSATPTSQPTPDAAALALTPTTAPVTGSVATPIPVDPAAAFGCYNASFVAHVTLPYAPAFNPGEKFTKTWRVKNTGTCDWSRGIKIAFSSGDRFGAGTTEIGQRVSAGSFAEITLQMTAPYLTGVVNSNWQLSTEIGKPFGQVLTTAITLPGTTSTGQTSGDCLNSALISDLDVGSGTIFNIYDSFTKSWKIKNTGTCTWTRDFKITFISGDVFGSDTTKIRQTVGPGSSTEISLSMVAPSAVGTYSSTWQMASDTGNLFGEYFTFSIIVK